MYPFVINHPYDSDMMDSECSSPSFGSKIVPYYPTALPLGNSCDLLMNSFDLRQLTHTKPKAQKDDQCQLTKSQVAASSQIYARDEFSLSFYMPEKDTGLGLEIDLVPHSDSSSIPIPTLEPTLDIGS